MPSLISHAAVAVAAGAAFAPRDVPGQFWALAVLCSILPDADVLGFSFGIPYHHVIGHRGYFHSPFFGLLLSILVVSIFSLGRRLRFPLSGLKPFSANGAWRL